jgi:hypothetical protein
MLLTTRIQHHNKDDPKTPRERGREKNKSRIESFSEIRKRTKESKDGFPWRVCKVDFSLEESEKTGKG